MDGRIERGKYGRKEGRMEGLMEGRKDGRMEGWMDGWMDTYENKRTGSMKIFLPNLIELSRYDIGTDIREDVGNIPPFRSKK